jgi:DNA-directed RNA polymerase subunit RPC12/RpoP
VAVASSLSSAPELNGGDAVIHCPVCESRRVVLVLAPDPRAFCVSCGARWVQDGSRQTGVKKAAASPGDPQRDRRER